jgi:D-glycero-alpha-D-manno-heptose 1-phosphate guanylyltransferase
MSTDAAIILCGGFGTRFRQVSSEPKILTSFRGNKFLDYIIEYLIRQGIKKIILSLGYESEKIIQYAQSRKYLNVEFVVENEVLDTGGALLLVNSQSSQDIDRFIVLNGDTFWSEDLPLDFIHCSNQEVCLMTHRVKQNDRYGAVKFQNGQLKFIHATGKESQVYSGIMSIPRRYLASEVFKISLEDYLETLNETAKFSIFEFSGEVIDFGTINGYDAFKKYT